MEGSDSKRRHHLIFNALSRDTSELENLTFIFLVGNVWYLTS